MGEYTDGRNDDVRSLAPTWRPLKAFISSPWLQVLGSKCIAPRYPNISKMPTYGGQCVCGRLRYSLSIDSPDNARTSLCHCLSCRRAFGTNFGLTTKVSD